MHSPEPTRDRPLAILPIKDLFNRRQYKQCAQHCLSIFECSSTTLHPLHEAFLHFYAASSFEMQARLLPDIATSKLPTLQSAEHHYYEALDALSKIKLRLSPTGSHFESPEETSSSQNSIRPSTSTSSSSSPSSLSTISLLSGSDSVFSDESRASPSPSRPPTNYHPTTPSAHKPASHLPTPQSSHSTPSPPLPTTLTTLTASLHAHITRTTYLQRTTADAQTCRDAIRARLGCDSSAADAASCAERIRMYDRMRRIEEGRARGWRRERYDGRRVREVSERAVGELGA